jgi:NitT/TauT family transport system substrate-binding protein
MPSSRRKFLAGTARTVVALGVISATPSIALASDRLTVVRAPYGAGFCSLGLFLVHARGLAEADGVALELVATPTFADHVTMVGSGAIDVSITPYTSVIALREAGARIRIVGGGGIEGCGLVSRPGLDSAEKLRGATLGTFQMDSLEVMAFDWLRANGVAREDVEVRYMGSTPEAVEAFKAGALDWISTIEPYVTTLMRDVPGAHLLSNGRDIYGPGYADCVMVAQADAIERRPEAVKAVIKALMRAQQAYESELDAVLPELIGTYYKTSLENARIAAANQPLKVDMRDQSDFVLARARSLVDMGYISSGLPLQNLFDWRLLEEAIVENRTLWASLQRRSAES